MSGDQASTLRAQSSRDASSSAGDDLAAAVPAPKSWRQLWQVPTVLISVGLIVLGISTSVQPPVANDFEGALAQVNQFLLDGQYELAGHQLRKTIEPNLETATADQRARFHAAAADYLYLANDAASTRDQAVDRQVLDQYAKSLALGLSLTAARLERSAEAFLKLGEVQNARNCLVALDALTRGGSHDAETHDDTTEASHADIQDTRNRVFRLLVQFNLEQADLPYDELMRTLSEYRQDPALTPVDEVWAVARQAELRLEAGFAPQAVDTLLVEMRRLEGGDHARSSANFGELYVLLGRGYFELGDDDKARLHLQRALEMFVDATPVKGEALALLGGLAQSRGELETAMEDYELVIRDFLGTPAFLSALLGRAEVQSLLGEHEASQADYRQVAKELVRSHDHQRVTASRVAESLCDRHDAVLALGNIDLALAYVTITEDIFKSNDVPEAVLIRLASTNRQVAENLVAQAASAAAETDGPIDPSIRHEANLKYERAADCYLRHANAQTVDANSGSNWTTSLWTAADSYDLGGRQDLAIEQWRRYLEGRPIDDPRRVETLFRLGQAHHARAEYESAVTGYTQVIQGYPRSNFAARSFVPLARCLLELNRIEDAKQQLSEVLVGDRLLKPDARDYRDALIELARIHHQQGEFIPAIEKFTEATERYPDDPRMVEVQFLLADSYRRNAQEIEAQIDGSSTMSAAEIGRLTALRHEHLQHAQELFAGVESRAGAAARFGAFQEDLIRRSQLYGADCAFHLKQFEQAVALYDQVARQYSSHHSSMYALIQIVNCYSAMGDAERSSAAHHRALVRLKQLPEDAFSSPDSLMDRAAWERWLENTPVGSGMSASAQPAHE